MLDTEYFCMCLCKYIYIGVKLPPPQSEENPQSGHAVSGEGGALEKDKIFFFLLAAKERSCILLRCQVRA